MMPFIQHVCVYIYICAMELLEHKVEGMNFVCYGIKPKLAPEKMWKPVKLLAVKPCMPRGSLLTCCSGNSFLALDTLSQIDGASLVRLQSRFLYAATSSQDQERKGRAIATFLVETFENQWFHGKYFGKKKKKRLLNVVQWFTVHIKFNFQRTSWILRLLIQGKYSFWSRRIFTCDLISWLCKLIRVRFLLDPAPKNFVFFLKKIILFLLFFFLG